LTKFTICIIIRLVEVVRLKEILYTYTVKSIDDASYNGEPLQNILFVSRIMMHFNIKFKTRNSYELFIAILFYNCAIII